MFLCKWHHNLTGPIMAQYANNTRVMWNLNVHSTLTTDGLYSEETSVFSSFETNYMDLK